MVQRYPDDIRVEGTETLLYLLPSKTLVVFNEEKNHLLYAQML